MAAELQKNSVLIIEDDIILCEELAKILRYEKFSIETAYDGKQGLELIESNGFKMIILDLKMPKVDGYEVLTRVKDKFPRIKVIVMTGSNLADEVLGRKAIYHSSADQKVKRTILRRADKIITKPFDVVEVINFLHKFNKN